MAEGKRYYWLKLYDDFFGSMRIKKLRKLAGGDTYLIIYLKLQLKAMKTDGIIQFTGLEQSIAEEIALDIDEAPDDVKVTLGFLVGCGLAETNAENSYMFLPYAVQNTGSEASSTQRSRECRERIRERKALQCNTDATQMQQPCNVEKELEIEKETRVRDKSKRKKSEATSEAILGAIRDYTQNEQLQSALMDFVQFRRDIKKPMSDSAIKLLTGKLTKLGSTDEERIEILNNSIINGWTGIYETKGADNGRQNAERGGNTAREYRPIGRGETVI